MPNARQARYVPVSAGDTWLARHLAAAVCALLWDSASLRLRKPGHFETSGVGQVRGAHIASACMSFV